MDQAGRTLSQQIVLRDRPLVFRESLNCVPLRSQPLPPFFFLPASPVPPVGRGSLVEGVQSMHRVAAVTGTAHGQTAMRFRVQIVPWQTALGIIVVLSTGLVLGMWRGDMMCTLASF